MERPFQIRPFESSDEEDVVSLWELTFPKEPPWNESRSLIRQKLTTQPELFFVCLDANKLIGTAIAGYDGVRGWVHKVASHPDYRGRSVARLLMETAEQALAKRGCVKFTLQGVYLLAESQALVGVCGFRSNGHVDHLFVCSSHQGQGVGKTLLIAAQLKLSPQILNLNASLNAIGFYESLGFEPIGEAGEVNGVKFQHMALGNLLTDE